MPPEYRFPEPSDEFYADAQARLPLGVRTLLADGIAEGIIIPAGRVFTLKGLAWQGPCAWFSRYNTEQPPNLNWDYYIQAAHS